MRTRRRASCAVAARGNGYRRRPPYPRVGRAAGGRTVLVEAARVLHASCRLAAALPSARSFPPAFRGAVRLRLTPRASCEGVSAAWPASQWSAARRVVVERCDGGTGGSRWVRHREGGGRAPLSPGPSRRLLRDGDPGDAAPSPSVPPSPPWGGRTRLLAVERYDDSTIPLRASRLAPPGSPGHDSAFFLSIQRSYGAPRECATHRLTDRPAKILIRTHYFLPLSRWLRLRLACGLASKTSFPPSE